MQTDREWADQTVDQYGVEELANFLGGNPDPTSTILMSCSDDRLAKAYASLFQTFETCHGEVAEEMVEVTIRNTAKRWEDETRRPAIIAALIIAVRRLAAPSTGRDDLPQVDSEASAEATL